MVHEDGEHEVKSCLRRLYSQLITPYMSLISGQKPVEQVMGRGEKFRKGE